MLVVVFDPLAVFYRALPVLPGSCGSSLLQACLPLARNCLSSFCLGCLNG